MRRPSIAHAAGPLMAAAWVVASLAPAAGARGMPTEFDRVEEDWELVINQPDLVAEGPQITTSMSPTADLSGLFFAFNLNYRGQPSFAPGGLEVVAFEGSRALGATTQHTAQLATAGEAIAWTQSMHLSGGVLTYEIIGGRAATWERFGQGSGTNLGLRATTGLGTLSGYSPEVSVSGSGPGWQSNRVASMRLVRVRYFAAGELVAVDETAREVGLGL